ncbi:hypothetical protein ONS95_009114 [Cadophora gregata]|uniref:uncharacterized protein n=1 Tax=Cadophora gregata TaxID=51156 RepID=UPI0026DCD2CE|nr:uncharacterized protein ONS95_009114 [Cadophora gregata]KAK0124131.1 hypothetical protein ONS95_009114 [Cadophora gregata]
MKENPKPGFQVLTFINSDLKIRDYKKQRQHRKSRSGCRPCKDKKVKCDECKPVCLRCRRNERACTYDMPDEGLYQHHISGSVTNTKLSPMSSITTLYPSPKTGTPGIQLLHHLCTNWDAIFRMPGHDELVPLTQSNPLIRNTFLAIAASHLRHMSPGILQHRIAEHFFQSLAIQDFQVALGTPSKSLGQQGANALLLAALLLNMLAFTLPHRDDDGVEDEDEDDPKSSWVFGLGGERMGWLALQAGLRPLSNSLSAYTDRTVAFLNPIMFGPGKAGWREFRKFQTLDIVPETWIRAFKLKRDRSNNLSSDSGSNCCAEDENEIFGPAMMTLAYLRSLQPPESMILVNWVFLTKIHGGLKSLLYERDERALWLLGYWLGLMCRYEGTWWCERRVRRDYEAVRLRLWELQLGERAGAEGVWWRELMQELEDAPGLT